VGHHRSLAGLLIRALRSVTFCLRYWLDPEGQGTFDLCAELGLLEQLALSLRENGVAVSIEASAKDYFDRNSGG
jgi:hypothetical protein